MILLQRLARVAVLAGLLVTVSGTAGAASVTCRLSYAIDGWSIFYQQYDGTGTVRCDNGQQRSVAIRVRGGGVSLGKMEINQGSGRFSAVDSIDEVFGTYVAVDGQGGATVSGEGRAMTKGKVGLTVSGTGRGWALGVAFSGFTLEAQ